MCVCAEGVGGGGGGEGAMLIDLDFWDSFGGKKPYNSRITEEI